MLNVLPRLTRDNDDASRGETRARMSSFAERMKTTVRSREAAPEAQNKFDLSIDGTYTDVTDEIDEARLVLPMTIVNPSASFVALQEWEGYVTAVRSDDFDAELVDLTGGRRHETEQSTFIVSDLEEADRLALREGALFRWVLGYQRLRGGTKQRVSQLYFRQVPGWTANELAAVERRASELADSLGLT